MNRRKFLKALFCIPLLAVVPKIAVVDEPEPIENYKVDWRDSLPDGYIWPTGGPDFKWSHEKFYHPNEGLCEFNGLRGFITTGKERLQQLDDYSKTPFMEMQIEKMREIINEFVEQSL